MDLITASHHKGSEAPVVVGDKSSSQLQLVEELAGVMMMLMLNTMMMLMMMLMMNTMMIMMMIMIIRTGLKGKRLILTGRFDHSRGIVSLKHRKIISQEASFIKYSDYYFFLVLSVDQQQIKASPSTA